MISYNCVCGNEITTLFAQNLLATLSCCNCGNVVEAYKFSHLNMGQNVTSNNYIGHYTSWCLRNSFSPLRFDILQDIFEGCETNDDFKNTLDALYIIQTTGTKLTFMLTNKDTKDLVATLALRLKIRLELFNRVPTGNNMILAYTLMEELTLKSFAEGNLDLNEKAIDRFDKLKNLAISTKHIPERKLAFDRSLDIFKKLTKLEV